jgi:hypothetical protein
VHNRLPTSSATRRRPRRRIHDPPDPQAAADTAGTPPVHRYVLATVPTALDVAAARDMRLRPPHPDHPYPDLDRQRIRRQPVLGGLINESEHAA